MDHPPTEVVFSLSSGTISSPGKKYSYLQGPVKVPSPWKRGRPKTTKPPCSVFQFIGVPGTSKYVDAVSRSKIRSHARRVISRQNGSHRPLLHEVESKDSIVRRGPSSPALGPASQGNLSQIPGVDPFNTSCIVLEPYMCELLAVSVSSRIWKNIYSLEEIGGWNPIKHYWLPLAFQDPALMHSFLACAEAYVHGYSASLAGPRWSRHLREVISIVNQRISMPVHAISKLTLAVIAGMALLEKGSGRHEYWRTHMKGLEALTRLLGGLETLHIEPLVLHKIYRADLYGSLDAGEPPFFRGPIDLGSIEPQNGTVQSTGFTEMCSLIDFHPTIFACICQLEGVEHFWTTREPISAHSNPPCSARENPRFSPDEIARVRHILTNTQYKLVLAVNSQHHVIVNPIKRGVFELTRIALIIYTLTILKERPQSTFVGERIANKFYQTLIVTSQEAQAASIPYSCDTENTPINGMPKIFVSSLLSIVPVDFILWALFLAVAVLPATDEWQEGDAMKPTLLKVFSILVQTSVPHPHDIKFRISKYLWLPSIHDVLFDYFYSDLQLRK